MKFVTVFEHKELTDLQSGVVVEMWESVHGTGSGKRKLKEQFNKAELQKFDKFYHTFRTWHLGGVSGTGVPYRHACTISDYKLMKRMCDFFGTYGD